MGDELADHVWWERVRRAAERQGTTGSKLMSDWCHAVLPVRAAEALKVELVPGRGWVEIPPERFTEEYIESETGRLNDELGVRLGVGPMP